MHPRAEDPSPSELALRATLEKKRGTPYTEQEWRAAKTNLLAFFRLLAEWDLSDAADTQTPHHKTRNRL